MSANLMELLVKSLGETCYMVLIAIVLATLIGLPLGRPAPHRLSS